MRAKRLMNASVFDFLSLECSTRSIIFDTVLSPKLLVVRTLITPDRLTQPEITSSPSPASRGRLSPVRATVLRAVEPSTTTPSIGTFSPGLTTMVSPTST